MRLLTQAIVLPRAEPWWIRREYSLANDGTIWRLIGQPAILWTQIPGPVGNVVLILAGYDDQTKLDTIFAHLDNAQIWVTQFSDPTTQTITWNLVTSVPEP